MQHDRAMGGAVGAHVLELEAIGQPVVDLHRAELPASPERIDDVKLELRPVKGTFARQLLELEPRFDQHLLEHGFGLVPLLVRADALLGAQRELDRDVRRTENARYTSNSSRLKALISPSICSGVQKMWASS